MTHILIPRTPSMNLLRPFIGCQPEELTEAYAAMVRIAEVQHARAGRSCLAQIEEPAKPVAEICSASHDDAEFGERAIKPLCDISGMEYGTPLYAGAAPAAVAPQGVVAWMHPETLNVISAAHKHDMSTEYGAETRRKAESHSVALVRAEQHAPAAPALEAPAAPAGDLALIVAALENGQPQMAHYAEPRERHAQALAAARRLAAAPQAPAAPAVDADPLGLRDVGEALMQTIERNADALKAVGWTAPMNCPSEIVVDLLNLLDEAKAAPAVDAEGERDAAFEAVRNRLCGLQRYSFVLDDDGVVRRAQDRTGSWIEFDDAHALFDPVAVDAAIAAQAAAKGA